MNKPKPLVVIVDEEARNKLNQLGWRYFSKGRKKNDRNHLIETPLGNTIEIFGTLVAEHELNYHTSEYFYLELTSDCNFSCGHCGVQGDLRHLGLDKLETTDARYLTDDFIISLAEALSGIIQ